MTDGAPAAQRSAAGGGRTARERLVQAFFGLLLLAMAAMWFYAWVLAPRGDPDRIHDQAWADAAEQRCALAREVLGAVRLEAPGVVERAQDVDSVTDAFASMVEDLRADPPTNADDADTVARWLDDYDTYLVDRREFTAALREDPTARFEVTAIEKRQITAVIDRYADVNGMQSCMTPGDVT